MAKQFDLMSRAIQKNLDASSENNDLKITISDFIELLRGFKEFHDRSNKRKQKIQEIVSNIYEKRTSRTK